MIGLPFLMGSEVSSDTPRLRTLKNLSIWEEVLEMVDLQDAGWSSVKAVLSSLITTYLATPACDATWMELSQTKSEESGFVTPSISPSDELRILQAVTNAWESWAAKRGTLHKQKGLLPSQSTSSEGTTASTAATFTSFTCAKPTTGGQAASATASTTSGLWDLLSNAGTTSEQATEADKYCYIYHRTDGKYKKSVLRGTPVPGSWIMGCSLYSVNAEGTLHTILDMKLPVDQRSQEIAPLEQVQERIQKHMAENPDSVHVMEKETTASFGWGKKRARRF